MAFEVARARALSDARNSDAGIAANIASYVVEKPRSRAQFRQSFTFAPFRAVIARIARRGFARRRNFARQRDFSSHRFIAHQSRRRARFCLRAIVTAIVAHDRDGNSLARRARGGVPHRVASSSRARHASRRGRRGLIVVRGARCRRGGALDGESRLERDPRPIAFSLSAIFSTDDVDGRLEPREVDKIEDFYFRVGALGEGGRRGDARTRGTVGAGVGRFERRRFEALDFRCRGF